MLRIVRRDPFYPILSMFDEFIKDTTLDKQKSESERVSAMALDLTETENDYRVLANMPGIKKEDVKVSLEKNQMTIEAKHHWEEETDKPNYHHRERFFGKYHRTIYLPDTCDSDKIKAKLEHGVLELMIPKKEPTPIKKVEIE